MRNKRLQKAMLKVAASAMAGAIVFGSAAPVFAAKKITVKDVFDADYYTSKYTDLNIVYGQNSNALYNHLKKFGLNEGRNFSTLIDVKKYRAAYPDLDASFGDNWDAYVNHYIQYGYKEGRDSFGTFNAKAYADRYSDLKAAFGYDVWLLYKHYILFGKKEGRDCTYHAPVVYSSNIAPVTQEQIEAVVNGPFVLSGRLLNPETAEPIANATITFTRIGEVFQAHADEVDGTDGEGEGNDLANGEGDTETNGEGDTNTNGEGEGEGDAEEQLPSVEYGNGYVIVRTDADGYYSASEFTEGLYNVQVEAEGFMTLTLNSIAIGYNSAGFSMPTLELLSGDMTGANTINGRAIDATTGDILDAVTINVRSGWNNYTGEVITSTVTDENGAYSLSLERGYYTLEFVREGYSSVYVNICSSNASPNAEGVLVPAVNVVESTQFRIVLTWGENPHDLDSHLVGPTNDGEFFHVFYMDKEYDESGENVARLDVDDVSSYGPETVTIVEARPDQVFYYSVHDYSNKDYDDSTEMSNSNANIKVYKGSELVAEFNVPTNKVGNVWNVFKIVNNEVVPIGNYSSLYNTIYGAYVGFDF